METSFLIEAIAYLAAAMICVPVAKRLGLGSVLGYLTAGVVVGPALLGVIGEEGKDVMHMAEFGVVIMLFLVGLELDPKQFWRMRSLVVGAGAGQVLVTALAVGLLAVWAGLSWQAAMATGLAMAMSSTAIVLQSLKEQGLSSTRAGRTSFAILLFQDVAVIPILAVLPLLAPPLAGDGGGSHHGSLVAHLPGWAQTLAVLAAVGVVVVFGRFGVAPLLRLVAGTRLRELFVASSLLIVVAIAYLMSLVEVSAALGTFIAGVVLANSEFRHELESDLEPVKGLLLGLFFMAVGASIDLTVVQTRPGEMIAIVAVILVVKGLVLAGVARSFRLATDQLLLVAVGMSQVGEFAFVLISVAGGKNILPADTVSVLMAVTALSMATTPILMLVLQRLILPRVGTPQVDDREADAIDEHHPVIIAGFGHFGSTVGRLLRANGVEATVLDHNSDTVDLLRRIGFRVYYGDATRLDLLLAAGAEHARLMIIAIDDPEVTIALVETVRKHFPHLRLLVRARHRFHAYELMDHGVENPYREHLDTSIRLGIDALRYLGRRAHSATRAAQAFRRYDEAAMRHLVQHRRNRESYVASVRAAIEEQERLLKADLSFDHTTTDHAWDAAPLRAAVQPTSPS